MAKSVSFLYSILVFQSVSLTEILRCGRLVSHTTHAAEITLCSFYLLMLSRCKPGLSVRVTVMLAGQGATAGMGTGEGWNGNWGSVVGGTALSAQAPSQPGHDLWGTNPSLHARWHTARDFFPSSSGVKAGRGSCHHRSGDSPTPPFGYLTILSRHKQGQPHTRLQSRQAAALRHPSPHPSSRGCTPAPPQPPNPRRDRTTRRLPLGAGPARPPPAGLIPRQGGSSPAAA